MLYPLCNISENIIPCTPGEKIELVIATYSNRKVSTLEIVLVFILTPHVTPQPDFFFLQSSDIMPTMEKWYEA